MSAISGNTRILFLKQGEVFTPIACLLNNSFSENSETFSITTRLDGGWRKQLPDAQSYNISFDGINQSTGISYNDLQVLKREQILITWGIGTAEDVIEFGQGHIIDLSCDDPTNQNSYFSGSILGYGQPTTNVSAIGINETDFLTDGDNNLITV